MLPILGALAGIGATPVKYRQGIVVAWDPINGTNRVNVDGQILENLPSLVGPESVSISPEDAVGLMVVGDTFIVLGRWAAPGSVPVAGIGIDGESVATSMLFNADTAGFIATTDGPDVAGLRVFTGRLLVLLTAHMLVQDIASMYFSYQLDGPTSVSPAQTRSAFLRGRVETSTVGNQMMAVIHKDLDPGEYSIAGRVQVTDVQGVPGNDAELGSRTIIVLPF